MSVRSRSVDVLKPVQHSLPILAKPARKGGPLLPHNIAQFVEVQSCPHLLVGPPYDDLASLLGKATDECAGSLIAVLISEPLGEYMAETLFNGIATARNFQQDFVMM